MDGPNVNLKLLQKVKDSRDELGHSKLIDFGTCNLHNDHGAIKACSEESDWNMKMFLKSCHKILKDSPARRDDFIGISGCTKYPYLSVQPSMCLFNCL